MPIWPGPLNKKMLGAASYSGFANFIHPTSVIYANVFINIYKNKLCLRYI